MHTLPVSLAREMFATLCGLLPPPANDTAEGRAARDEVAMAAVAALHPTDAFEANLAVDIVVLEAQARDGFRLAGLYRNDLAAMLRCRAQATGMLRQMRTLLRDYRQTQAAHDKALAEAHPAAMERAGYWYHEATVPEPAPAVPSPAAPAPAFETLPEAEQYALLYPDRAARIRAAGGLPARLDFGPPEPEIVEALIRGTSPTLRALDRKPVVMA